MFRAVLFALLAAAAVLLAAYQTPNPGVTIKFELYEDGVKKTDLLGRSDVAAAVFVRAITPDGEAPYMLGPRTGSCIYRPRRWPARPKTGRTC